MEWLVLCKHRSVKTISEANSTPGVLWVLSHFNICSHSISWMVGFVELCWNETWIGVLCSLFLVSKTDQSFVLFKVIESIILNYLLACKTSTLLFEEECFPLDYDWKQVLIFCFGITSLLQSYTSPKTTINSSFLTVQIVYADSNV